MEHLPLALLFSIFYLGLRHDRAAKQCLSLLAVGREVQRNMSTGWSLVSTSTWSFYLISTGRDLKANIPLIEHPFLCWMMIQPAISMHGGYKDSHSQSGICKRSFLEKRVSNSQNLNIDATSEGRLLRISFKIASKSYEKRLFQTVTCFSVYQFSNTLFLIVVSYTEHKIYHVT